MKDKADVHRLIRRQTVEIAEAASPCGKVIQNRDMSFTDTNQLRQQLITAYKALTPLEQAVMQLLSVIYEPVT